MPRDVAIPVRNRRQAMDWSLVLASQGIGHRIDYSETTGWTLSVSAADHANALAHIHQYRLENRHWHWRRPVFSQDVFFDWGCVAWLLLITFFYVWSIARPYLRSIGEMRGTAFAHGEIWRLFTATWLHADPGHFALNAVFGFLFLGLATGRFGPGIGLCAAYLAGAVGNILSGWIHGPSMHGLGASGVVMGALGLITLPSVALLKRNGSRLFAASAFAGLLLFILTGTNPNADVVAHLGGFISGLMLGSLMILNVRLVRKPLVNLSAGILFGLLVILPWWLALMSSH